MSTKGKGPAVSDYTCETSVGSSGNPNFRFTQSALNSKDLRQFEEKLDAVWYKSKNRCLLSFDDFCDADSLEGQWRGPTGIYYSNNDTEGYELLTDKLEFLSKYIQDGSNYQ
ncbi:uncharacterized protein L201_000276 [Kwoniella dendrophila CBS 6074]|uniref:Uncharacterized protein n=1 Tax=Kwoniella dendrophila CBS 6074 TaxID=1295534 RepID=A0AAX4JKH2_9TREE